MWFHTTVAFAKHMYRHLDIDYQTVTHYPKPYQQALEMKTERGAVGKRAERKEKEIEKQALSTVSKQSYQSQTGSTSQAA